VPQQPQNPTVDDYVGRRVVLDTQGPLLYIGTLAAVDERGYWLVDADVHNGNDGHATNEEYVNDACLLERQDVRHVNRRRVYVARAAIVSVSALDEVVADGQPPNTGTWMS
jgi:small nuclear ribonucleoprotein (snRNP)-like protein